LITIKSAFILASFKPVTRFTKRQEDIEDVQKAVRRVSTMIEQAKIHSLEVFIDSRALPYHDYNNRTAYYSDMNRHMEGMYERNIPREGWNRKTLDGIVSVLGPLMRLRSIPQVSILNVPANWGVRFKKRLESNTPVSFDKELKTIQAIRLELKRKLSEILSAVEQGEEQVFRANAFNFMEIIQSLSSDVLRRL